MRASTSRCRPTFSRQQSHRTTRRTVLTAAIEAPVVEAPGTSADPPSIASPAGFQPVSSQRGQGMSVEVTAKLDRLPQLALGARLDLANAFAREVQPVTDLLQCPGLVVFETESQPDDLPLLPVEPAQCVGKLVQIVLMDQVVGDARLIDSQQIAQLERMPVAAGRPS